MNFFLALLFPFVFANAASYSLTGENLLTGEKITISSENKKGLVVVFLSAKCPLKSQINFIFRILFVSRKQSYEVSPQITIFAEWI